MRIWGKLRWLVLSLVALPSLYFAGIWGLNAGVGRWLLTFWVNRAYAPLVKDSFAVNRVVVEPSLRVQVDGARARIQTQGEPLTLFCDRATLNPHGMTWRLTLRAPRINLSTLSAVNPAWFKEAQGVGHGSATLSGRGRHVTQLKVAFEVDQPGGTMQAPFLSAILPYVPAAARTVALERAARSGDAVRFTTAWFTLDSASSKELKALLLMTLPEYNVSLDVDFTIRLAELSLSQAWREFFSE